LNVRHQLAPHFPPKDNRQEDWVPADAPLQEPPTRSSIFDVHAATGSPIAKEALDRISQLYAVEKMINGSPPERRRQQRRLQSKPIAEVLAAWADQTARQLSRKSELAQAFRYMRARWTALGRCFDDGRLALDNNPAEHALRCVAIGRKNYLFAGSDAGGRRAAALYSLIESAKLNGLNLQHYLADVLARIADHPARRSLNSCPGTGNHSTSPALPPEPVRPPDAYPRPASPGLSRSAARLSGIAGEGALTNHARITAANNANAHIASTMRRNRKD
jgi:hypothetical protein